MSATRVLGDSVTEIVAEPATRPVTVPRILVLDDDADGWAPITRALRQRGLGVLVSGANGAALELVTACQAEVVILELTSPARAALDFVRKVKAASPETEMILTAGQVAINDVIAALRDGAFDVVCRPFKSCELVTAIVRAIEKRKRARDASVLAREGQMLLSVRERERLPALIVDFAHRAMRADVVSLMLRDTAGRLYIAAAQGLPPELLAGTRLHMGQRIAGRVAELRSPILIDDELGRDARFEDLVPFGRVRSSIVHPLLSEERLIGVLNIGRSSSEPAFVSTDLDRAGLVVGQVVLALETLRHWQRTGMAERLIIVGQVASSVAHEINNPLAAVVGQSGLALDSLDGALARLKPGAKVCTDDLRAALLDVRQCLEETQTAAASMQAVASDLRAAVQADGGTHTFDVAETIRAALRLSTANVRKRISIIRNVEPGLFVAGDSGLLCQVFLSLILNANQALRSSATPAPEIRIDSLRAEGGFRIDVTDNGPGMASEDLARIFEPFFTGGGAYPKPGMGLSIANDIVQGFGGHIDVKSRVGLGTSFSVQLPAAPMSEQRLGCSRAHDASRSSRAA